MPTPKKITLSDQSVRWSVRFRDGTTNASERFVDQKSAQQFCDLLAAVGGARARAIMNEHEPDKVMTHSLGQVIDMWWEWKSATKKDGSLLRVRAPYTLTRYEQLIRLHVKPALGHLPVNVVSEADVQEWVDELASSSSPKVCADAHSVLHQVYKWAAAKSRGYAVIDPCAETTLPEKSKRVVRGLKPDEWVILHAAAMKVDPDAADVLEFLVQTGWRWSEAVAVRAMDVDDDGDEIDDKGVVRPRVWVTMGRVLRRTGDNRFEYVDGDGKSQAALRRIRLGRSGAALVRRRMEGLASHDLLLRTRKGKPWRYSSFHSDYWTFSTLSQDGPRTRRRILQQAFDDGLERAADVELHWFRHTHAVLALLAGESLAAVQKRLGHEDIRTTVGVYGSMVNDISVDGLDALDGLLGGSPARAIG